MLGRAVVSRCPWLGVHSAAETYNDRTREVELMSIVTPEVLTRTQAIERYDALVASIGDVEDFKLRAEAYELDDEDVAVYDDLVELEYLLGR